MPCDKCAHCKRIADKLLNHKVKVNKVIDPIRKCLDCGIEKPINDYSKSTNSNNISPSYRRTCKKCIINKQKEYMKDYHTKHYISQKQPRDENGKIIVNTDNADIIKNNI